jgi:hypothetical protein
MRKSIALVMLALVALFSFTAACSRPSDTVSHNLSVEADNFRVLRRVVFYNGITNEYMLTIEGFCALGNSDAAGELTVVCKVSEGDEYKKHFLGLSDNVTYFVEQLDGFGVSPDHYIVQFRPSTILPDIRVE